jgi:flagellar biosynthesis component FlhA
MEKELIIGPTVGIVFFAVLIAMPVPETLMNLYLGLTVAFSAIIGLLSMIATAIIWGE